MKTNLKGRLRRLINPVSEDQEQRNKEYILNVLLLAVWGLFVVFGLVIIIFRLFVADGNYSGNRLFGILSVLFVLSVLFALSKSGRSKIAASFFIACFFALSSYLIYMHNIFLPQGILFFALTIVMSGILISSRASFITAAATTLIFSSVLCLHKYGFVEPDNSWLSVQPSFGDVIGYTATFFAITVVSWLLYREMKRSLDRAIRSEQKYKELSETLEARARKRANELHQVQTEKLNQLYRFAELGHTTTALFHDLANRITVLSMDVENLGKAKGGPSDLIDQTHESIKYVEDMIKQVRYQAQGHEAPTEFDINKETQDIVESLSYKHRRQNVEISIHNSLPGKSKYHGDRIVYRQIIGSIISNAIDAYNNPIDSKSEKKYVIVKLIRSGTTIKVIISDHGRGIDPDKIDTIFEPFYSTKKDGMGIGLFIARQLAEHQLGGSLTVQSEVGVGSTFTLVLPRKNNGKNN